MYGNNGTNFKFFPSYSLKHVIYTITIQFEIVPNSSIFFFFSEGII